jgi:chromosome segregation ATPase
MYLVRPILLIKFISQLQVTSMSLFHNNKLSKNINEEELKLKELGSKLEERFKEKENLDRILKGMRSEVATMMEQIKNLSKQIDDLNHQKINYVTNIDNLNDKSLLLLKNYQFEEQTFFALQNKLNELKEEIFNNEPYNEKLIPTRIEDNLLKEKISKENGEIKEPKKEKVLLLTKENISLSKDFNSEPIESKLKKCSAITLSDFGCKNSVITGSDYCYAHRHLNKRTIKTKQIN